MFKLYPKSTKWVGCELLDGAYVSGQLYSYSIDSEETEDRELVIREPEYQAPGARVAAPMQSALTTISARHINFLSVNYRTPAEIPKPPSLRDRVPTAWKLLRGKVSLSIHEQSAMSSQHEGVQSPLSPPEL